MNMVTPLEFAYQKHAGDICLELLEGRCQVAQSLLNAAPAVYGLFDSESVHYLTEERAVELLRCLHDEPNMCYRAAVLLALLCGLRLGEVGALRLSDVDWEHCTIDIGHALK